MAVETLTTVSANKKKKRLVKPGKDRRFRHKGKDKVYMDFAILAMAHNLRKLLRKAQNEPTERFLSRLSRRSKPYTPHITLLGANNRNYGIAA